MPRDGLRPSRSTVSRLTKLQCSDAVKPRRSAPHNCGAARAKRPSVVRLAGNDPLIVASRKTSKKLLLIKNRRLQAVDDTRQGDRRCVKWYFGTFSIGEQSHETLQWTLGVVAIAFVVPASAQSVDPSLLSGVDRISATYTEGFKKQDASAPFLRAAMWASANVPAGAVLQFKLPARQQGAA